MSIPTTSSTHRFVIPGGKVADTVSVRELHAEFTVRAGGETMLELSSGPWPPAHGVGLTLDQLADLVAKLDELPREVA